MARFLNIRLDNISVEDPERHPHMVSVYILFFFFRQMPNVKMGF